jgi:hypothetical protein
LVITVGATTAMTHNDGFRHPLSAGLSVELAHLPNSPIFQRCLMAWPVKIAATALSENTGKICNIR